MFRRIKNSFALAIQVAIIGFGKSFRDDEDLESLLGYRDPLTNMLNLKAFEEDSRKVKEGYALIVVDVDDFKKINDEKGHLHGDAILKRLAGILEQATGTHGKCYRLHGDEFAIIVGRSEAGRVCGLIQRNIREEDGFTVSQGVVLELKSHEPGRFFSLADEALYQSKRDGRNRTTTVSMPAYAA